MEVLAVYESSSRRGLEHNICRSKDGKDIYCSCMGWRYSKSVPKTCRHLKHWYYTNTVPTRVSSTEIVIEKNKDASELACLDSEISS